MRKNRQNIDHEPCVIQLQSIVVYRARRLLFYYLFFTALLIAQMLRNGNIPGYYTRQGKIK